MSQSAPELVRTNLYLSHYVWGQLKLAAFDEHTTANDIINQVVEHYLLLRPQNVPRALHREHNKDEGRQPRTIRFQPGLWAQLQRLAQAEQFSIASLVESLLLQRLGLQPQPEPAAPTQPEVKTQIAEAPARYLQVGETTFDLGANPRVIDLNGNPLPKTPKKRAGTALP